MEIEAPISLKIAIPFKGKMCVYSIHTLYTYYFEGFSIYLSLARRADAAIRASGQKAIK